MTLQYRNPFVQRSGQPKQSGGTHLNGKAEDAVRIIAALHGVKDETARAAHLVQDAVNSAKRTAETERRIAASIVKGRGKLVP